MTRNHVRSGLLLVDASVVVKKSIVEQKQPGKKYYHDVVFYDVFVRGGLQVDHGDDEFGQVPFFRTVASAPTRFDSLEDARSYAENIARFTELPVVGC